MLPSIHQRSSVMRLGTRLLPILFLGLMLSPSTTQAQHNPVPSGLRASAFGGWCYSPDGSDNTCPIFAASLEYYVARNADDGGNKLNQGRALYSVQTPRPMRRRAASPAAVGIKGTYVNAATDKWPPPPPGGGLAFAKSGIQADEELKHGGTQVFLGEVAIAFPIKSKFALEPFVGGGIAKIKRETGEIDQPTFLEDFDAKVFAFGLTFSVPVGRSFDFQTQYRILAFFPEDDLTYVMPDGSTRALTDKNIFTHNALLGLGWRF